MNKLIQVFLERLTDRITALIGSIIGSTAAAHRVAQQARQQSYLEDLARQYEAEDKPDLAASIRHQAARIGMDDPAADARPVINNVLADPPALPSPDDTEPSAEATGQSAGRKRRTRTSRRTVSVEDDLLQ